VSEVIEHGFRGESEPDPEMLRHELSLNELLTLMRGAS